MTEKYGIGINIILMFVVPTVLLLVHTFIGRKTYAKNYNLYVQLLYVQLYEKEIEPYRYQDNFDEVIATKQYYDVAVKVKDLSEDKQRLYKKYRNKGILYSLLLVFCIALTIYFCNKFDLDIHSWIVIVVIIVYTLVFYILIDNCDVEMNRIKNL